MPEERVLYKIHVRGRVQGVGFRWNTANEAKNRGINGFVRNNPDGSVYIEAEGTRAQLETYLQWCKNSPGMSRVEFIDKESFPAVGYAEFRIEF